MKEDGYYECPTCSYGTNSYSRFLKHGLEHSSQESISHVEHVKYLVATVDEAIELIPSHLAGSKMKAKLRAALIPLRSI